MRGHASPTFRIAETRGPPARSRPPRPRRLASLAGAPRDDAQRTWSGRLPAAVRGRVADVDACGVTGMSASGERGPRGRVRGHPGRRPPPARPPGSPPGRGRAGAQGQDRDGTGTGRDGTGRRPGDETATDARRKPDDTTHHEETTRRQGMRRHGTGRRPATDTRNETTTRRPRSGDRRAKRGSCLWGVRGCPDWRAAGPGPAGLPAGIEPPRARRRCRVHAWCSCWATAPAVSACEKAGAC